MIAWMRIFSLAPIAAPVSDIVMIVLSVCTIPAASEPHQTPRTAKTLIAIVPTPNAMATVHLPREPGKCVIRSSMPIVAPLVLAVPGGEVVAERLRARLDGEPVEATVRTFPDGEVYVRIETPVEGRAVVLAGSLDHPADKLLALFFLAATARDLG